VKIALIVPSLGVDGDVETPAISLLVRQLASAVDLHVVTLRHPRWRENRVVDGARVHAIGGGSGLRAVARATFSVLIREHRREPFDVIHGLWLHEPGTIAVLAGRAMRVPVLASIGGAEVAAIPDIGYGALLSRRGRLVCAQVLRRASLVSGGSTFVLQRARQLVPDVPSDRFRLAPLPVDTDRFTPAHSHPTLTPRPRLFHAASLIPVKDQGTLLRGFAHVARDVPNARLTIVGADPFGLRPALEHLAIQFGLEQLVRFTGGVPHACMPALYRESDLFLLSSRHESQGMVVLEAAASGVPTVGTAVGVIPDLAPGAASSVPIADSWAFAAAVVDLLRDDNRRRAMAVDARARAESDYGATVATRRFAELYDELAARAT
jgi:glycosyltransferase involved in cell wall biosynthesis